MDLAWIDWRSVWLGAIAAYVLPWTLLVGAIGICCAVRDARAARRGRRTLRALTEPGVPIDELTAALAARQARRDTEAVEELLGSLKREDGCL